MPELAKPYSMLDLANGESVAFTVVRYETGDTIITPPHAPDGKHVKVLRLHVRREDKPDFPPYYDITSTRLYPQLLPQLQIAKWRITARGFPPKRYFSVERTPR